MRVVTLNGDDPVTRWMDSRKLQTGSKVEHCVLIEDRAALDALARRASEEARTPEAIVAASVALDLDAWFESRGALVNDLHARQSAGEVARYLNEYGLAEESLEEGSDPHESFAIFSSLHAARARHSQPHEALMLALEMGASHESFALLKWGGASEHDPPPEVHLAVHSLWSERYGSEVVGFGKAGVECFVTSPPATMNEALALAREQAAYCPALIWHTFDALDILARSLIGSSVWSFRWR